MKLSKLWNWLVNEGEAHLSSSSNKEKTRKDQNDQLGMLEIFQQLERLDACQRDNLSSIEKTLIKIQEQLKMQREEHERVLQRCNSILTKQDQQMAFLRDLKTEKDSLSVTNQRQGVETTISNGTDSIHSFKELYCRQLSEGKDGFNVNDLTDSPNSNCYIIKQYDETHATLNIVDDSLIRSQMISGFTDFIAPICDFDGQSPTGKNCFDVKEFGELEIYCEKWLIKKKMKIQFF